MKKFLLLSAAVLAFSVGSFAQQQKKVIMPKKQVTASMIKEAKNVSFTNKNVTRRSVEDGFFYYRPVGSLNNTLSPDFRYSYFPLMYVGANAPVKFWNAAEDPTVAYWQVNERNYNEENPEWVDEDNNFFFEGEEGFSDSGWYYIPVLTDGGKFSYYWAESAEDIGMELSGGYTVEPYVAVADTVEWMSLVCGETASLYGSINDGYPYGSRDVSDLLGAPAGSYLMNGIWQFYNKPISPLWFDQVSLLVKSDSETPLADGTSLKMKIVKAGYNEKGGVEYYEDQVIAELEAKPENMVVTEAQGGNWYALIFKNEVEDEFGVSTEPVVVDESFAVIIDGFFDKGVDVCCFASEQLPDEEDWVARTLWRLTDSEGNLKEDHYGWVGCNAFLSFSGIFDGAKVVEKETYQYTDGTTEEVSNLNYLKIGDDLKSVNMGEDSQEYATVKTIMPWFDSNDNEQYYFEMPEWLEITDNQVLNITDTYSDGSTYTYGWGLAFTATSAVPDGATVNGKPGRFAEIIIEGKGVVSNPIYVLQGDITIEDVQAELDNPTGINTVKTDDTVNNGKTYSLSGAQVNKHHHGVVIRNGKKMIQK